MSRDRYSNSNNSDNSSSENTNSSYSNSGNQSNNSNSSTSGSSRNFSRGGSNSTPSQESSWAQIGSILESKNGKPYFKANDLSKMKMGRRLELIAVDVDSGEEFIINMAALSQPSEKAPSFILNNLSVNLTGDGVTKIDKK